MNSNSGYKAVFAVLSLLLSLCACAAAISDNNPYKEVVRSYYEVRNLDQYLALLAGSHRDSETKIYKQSEKAQRFFQWSLDETRISTDWVKVNSAEFIEPGRVVVHVDVKLTSKHEASLESMIFGLTLENGRWLVATTPLPDSPGSLEIVRKRIRGEKGM